MCIHTLEKLFDHHGNCAFQSAWMAGLSEWTKSALIFSTSSAWQASMDRSQPLVTFGRERSDVSTFNSPVMLRDQRSLLHTNFKIVKRWKLWTQFSEVWLSYINFHFFAVLLKWLLGELTLFYTICHQSFNFTKVAWFVKPGQRRLWLLRWNGNMEDVSQQGGTPQQQLLSQGDWLGIQTTKPNQQQLVDCAYGFCTFRTQFFEDISWAFWKLELGGKNSLRYTHFYVLFEATKNSGQMAE